MASLLGNPQSKESEDVTRRCKSSAGFYCHLLLVKSVNSFVSDDVYRVFARSGLDPAAIMRSDYGTYKGYVAESFIAQQLISHCSGRIYSWHAERSEVEFLLPVYGGEVIPVEVKAGTVLRAKSLEKYINKYQPTRSYILSGAVPRLSQSSRVRYLPLYLVESLAAFVL